MEFIYLNDQILSASQAKISPLDLSVLRGYGVMDYLRTYNRVPFRLNDHLNRFKSSAELLHLPLSKSIAEMSEIVTKLIDHVPFPEVGIKLILTGGVSTDQYLPEGPPTFFAVAYPFDPFPKKYFDEGIKVITECYARPFPTAKSIHYFPAIIAMKKGEEVGAVDVLFHNEREHLLETGTANFFAFKNGTLLTPDTSILKGITRQVVLELARDLFHIEERVLHMEELKDFDALFLTSSNKEVMPISEVNNTVFSISSEVRMIMEAFANYVSNKKLLQNI